MASPIVTSPVAAETKAAARRQTVRFTTTAIDRIQAQLREAQEKLAPGTTERQHAAGLKALAKVATLLDKPRGGGSAKQPSKTNPYNEFVKEAMKQVLSDPANEGKSNSEQMSICAAMWREHKAQQGTPESAQE